MKATKNFSIILLLIFVSVQVYSQNGSSFSFESGALHNRILSQDVPLNNSGLSDIGFYQGGCLATHQIPYYDVKTTDGDYGSGYGIKYKFYNTTGYFLKSSYQKRIHSSKNWDFILPLGISYQHKIDKVSSNSWSYGNFGNSFQFTKQEITSKIINFSLGAMFKFRKQSVHIETAVYYNISKTLKSSIVTDLESSSKGKTSSASDYTYRCPKRFMGSSLSAQIAGGYYITKSISVGPTLEVFFTSRTSIFKKSEFNKNYFGSYENYIFGLNKKNIWVNPGIKIQFDLD